MSKIQEFYAAVIADEIRKKALYDILGDTAINDASDEQLDKIGKLACDMGYDISVDEAKNFLRAAEAELDDDDLDAVAGGKGEDYVVRFIYCEIGGGPDANNAT